MFSCFTMNRNKPKEEGGLETLCQPRFNLAGSDLCRIPPHIETCIGHSLSPDLPPFFFFFFLLLLFFPPPSYSSSFSHSAFLLLRILLVFVCYIYFFSFSPPPSSYLLILLNTTDNYEICNAFKRTPNLVLN